MGREDVRLRLGGARLALSVVTQASMKVKSSTIEPSLLLLHRNNLHQEGNHQLWSGVRPAPT